MRISPFCLAAGGVPRAGEAGWHAPLARPVPGLRGAAEATGEGRLPNLGNLDTMVGIVVVLVGGLRRGSSITP